jgi:titin
MWQRPWPARTIPKVNRRAFTLTEMVSSITIVAALAVVSYAAYNAVLNDSNDRAGEQVLGQLAKAANADWVTSRSWTEAVSSAADELAVDIVRTDSPTDPQASTTYGELSYRAAGKRLGLAMVTKRGQCAMALVDQRNVSVWTVESDLGAACAGRSALLGEQPAAAYTSTPTDLGAVTGLTATPGRARVDLAWSGTAASFRVDRDGKTVATVGTTTYADTGLASGTTYAYTVTPVGENGATGTAGGPASALTAPAAPGGLWAEKQGGGVSATWNAVSGTVTGYRLYVDGTQVWQGAGTAATWETSTSPAQVTVTAYNATGESEQSDAVSLAVALSAPRSVAATGGDRTATVTWLAPAQGTPREYDVLVDGAVVGTTTQRTFQVTGLRNGTTYSVVVRAKAPSLDSVDSGSVSVTPGVAPGAPSNVTVSVCAAAQPTAVTAVWTAPADDPNNPLLGYRLYLNQGTAEVAYVRAPLTSAVVTGLTIGSSNTVSVRAHRTGGLSAPVASASFVAGCAPSAPTMRLVDYLSLTSYSTSFVPGSNGGLPADTHEVRCSSIVASANVGIASVPPSASSVLSTDVTGLSSMTYYTCRARSRNAVGWSAWSSSLGPPVETTPAAPSAPSVSATYGPLNVTFTWTPAVAGPSAPVRGHHLVVDGYGPVCSVGPAVSSCTVQTLPGGSPFSFGATYTARVQSWNYGGAAMSGGTTFNLLDAPATPSLSVVSSSGSSIIFAASSAATAQAPVDGYDYYDSAGNLLGSSSTTFSWPSLSPGVQYCAKAKAKNAAATSAFSSTVCGYTVAAAPSVSALSRSLSGTTIAMSAAANAAGASAATEFWVYRGGFNPADAGANRVAVLAASGLNQQSWADAGLAGCTNYTYNVVARGPWASPNGLTAPTAITVGTLCQATKTYNYAEVDVYKSAGSFAGQVQSGVTYAVFGSDSFYTGCTDPVSCHFSAGIRFPAMSLPAGATLTSCSLQLRANNLWAYTNGRFHMEMHRVQANGNLPETRPSYAPATGAKIYVSSSSIARYTEFVFEASDFSTLHSSGCNAWLNGTMDSVLIGPWTKNGAIQNLAGELIGSTRNSYRGSFVYASGTAAYNPRVELVYVY